MTTMFVLENSSGVLRSVTIDIRSDCRTTPPLSIPKPGSHNLPRSQSWTDFLRLAWNPCHGLFVPPCFGYTRLRTIHDQRLPWQFWANRILIAPRASHWAGFSMDTSIFTTLQQKDPVSPVAQR
jgi:hypothetical protein